MLLIKTYVYFIFVFLFGRPQGPWGDPAPLAHIGAATGSMRAQGSMGTYGYARVPLFFEVFNVFNSKRIKQLKKNKRN